MFRQQTWMENNDEFDHIIKNSQRVLKLSTKYENHPFAEEFKRDYNVVFIQRKNVLQGGADASFSLRKTCNLLQDAVDPLPNNASVFFRQMINDMRALIYFETTPISPLSIKITKHAHKIMMRRALRRARYFGGRIKKVTYDCTVSYFCTC